MSAKAPDCVIVAGLADCAGEEEHRGIVIVVARMVRERVVALLVLRPASEVELMLVALTVRVGLVASVVARQGAEQEVARKERAEELRVQGELQERAVQWELVDLLVEERTESEARVAKLVPSLGLLTETLVPPGPDARTAIDVHPKISSSTC